MCLAQYYFRVGLIAGLDLIIVQIIIHAYNYFSVANFLVVGTLILARFVGSVSFNYSLKDVLSESRNANKLYLTFLTLGNVILLSLFKSTMFIHICSFALFAILFISKGNSLIKN
jgi:hypothetical protein